MASKSPDGDKNGTTTAHAEVLTAELAALADEEVGDLESLAASTEGEVRADTSSEVAQPYEEEEFGLDDGEFDLDDVNLEAIV